MRNKNVISPIIIPGATSWGSKKQIQLLLMMLTTAAGVYLCWKLTLPFLSIIIWALTLSILFFPFHRWLETKLKQANLATTFSILTIFLIVIAPTIFLGTRLITESIKGAGVIKQKIESGEWRQSIDSYPRFASARKWIEEQTDLPGTLNNFYSWLTNLGASFVQGSVVQLASILFIFYLLFYFLRDREIILHFFSTISPFPSSEMKKLFREVFDIVHATVYGTLVVASLKGILGGLIFWCLDLPAALFWGLAMAFLSIIPMLGAFIIWVPATIFLALEGHWDKALILSLWGGLIISGIDNFLYPLLVGSKLRIHPVLVFISFVGGLIVFGPSGIILGPVVLSITKSLLGIWSVEIRNEN